MYCSHCGASIPDDSRFCTSCGAPQAASVQPPVDAPYAASVQPPAGIPQAISAQPSAGYQPPFPVRPPRSRRRLVWLAVVLPAAVLALAAVFVFAVLPELQYASACQMLKDGKFD
ncbi:MAG: zinc ribbon domain-containing protein, partial [Christensenellales bacterium]